MINFDTPILSQEYILSKVSDKQIFDYYIGQPYKLGQLIKSNLRENDNTPSFNVFNTNNGLKYKDFAHSSGNCFEYVKNLYGCSYKQALEIIARDFNLKSENTTTIIKPKISSYVEEVYKKRILPIKRGWNLLDKKYWTDKYYITLELLNDFDIFPLQAAYLQKSPDEIKLWAEHTDSNPIYCYKLDDTYKCYRPYADKKYKWLSTTELDDIQGMKQLPEKGELLIITSSMKDVLVLRLLGYYAIALGGEGNSIPDHIINYLWACFDNIVVFYDNDEAGLKYGKILSNKIGAGNIYIPEEYKEKDISDFIDIHRYDETQKLMNKLL